MPVTKKSWKKPKKTIKMDENATSKILEIRTKLSDQRNAKKKQIEQLTKEIDDLQSMIMEISSLVSASSFLTAGQAFSNTEHYTNLPYEQGNQYMIYRFDGSFFL